MMRKHGDVMRVFACCLGRRRPGDWLDLRLLRDLRNNDARGGLDPARTVEPERRSSPSTDSRHRRGGPPSRVIVSPWPGVVAGAGVSAFGILLLAIRRLEKV